MDLLCLRVAQMLISPDLAIFVVTTDDRQTTDGQNRLLYPLRACARGKKKALAMGVAIIIIMHLRKITKLSLVGRQEAILNFNSKQYVICSIWMAHHAGYVTG